MKWFATILIVLFVSCSNPEADKLRQENAQLKSQLETVVQERDALKTQVESVRSALGQGMSGMPSSGTGSGDSSSSTGDSSSSTTSPNDSSGNSSSSNSSSDPGTSSTTPPSSPQVTPAVLAYAQDVLKVAATYGAASGTPPTDCAKGYEAGSSKLMLSEGIALKSCAVETVSNQLRVTLETIDGAKLTLPMSGP